MYLDKSKGEALCLRVETIPECVAEPQADSANVQPLRQSSLLDFGQGTNVGNSSAEIWGTFASHYCRHDFIYLIKVLQNKTD